MVTQASTTKNYEAIAKAKIRKPRDRPLSVLVYGRFKKGKTHFCTTAPNVLILDPEEGTDGLAEANPDVWPLNEWSDFDEVYKFLKTGKHDYEYVAFDGMSRFANMALRYARSQAAETNLNSKPGGTRIQDYGTAGELMKGMMYNFHSLPLGKIYTAHERAVNAVILEEDEESPIVKPEDQIYVPDLPAGTRGSVNALVDVIGRAYTIRKDHPTDMNKKVTSYRLWLAPTHNYDTGFRSEYRLPDYLINPSVAKLTTLIKTGSVNA